MTLSTLDAVPSKLGVVTRSRSADPSTRWTQTTPSTPSTPSTRATPPSPGNGPRSRARSIVMVALGALSVAMLGTIPAACSSGGVGDPCTPEDEYQANFDGFTVNNEQLESNSFQCATRICLINHFQGRVSCPLGQAQPTACNPNEPLPAGCTNCALSQVYAPTCVTCGNDPSCTAVNCPNGLTCTPDATGSETGTCTCDPSTTPTTSIDGVSYVCQASTSPTGFSLTVLQSYICHEKNNCQTAADGPTTANSGKDCCVPGSDNPVSVPVCGQCATSTERDANDAVYCSCRCCAPCCPDLTMTPEAASAAGCSTDLSTCGEGNPNGNQCDPNFNYCTCPGGFSCTGIQPNIGLGNKELAGAYCVKTGTAYTGQTSSCSTLIGYGGEAGATGSGISCQGTAQSP